MVAAKESMIKPEFRALLHKILLAGTSCAIILMAIGLIMLLTYEEIDIDKESSLDDFADQISSVSAEGILGIGILVIISVPILRVLTSIAIFSRSRDSMLVIISISVLIIIMLGFLQGVT